MNTVTETTAINKGGHDIFSLSVSRSGKGLIVRVKAHVSIEEFFHTLSGGASDPVSMHGRWWRPMRESDKLPEVYRFNHPVNGPYILGMVGQDLMVASGRLEGEPRRVESDYLEEDDPESSVLMPSSGGRLVPNISFLRFKGISDGNGVEFAIPTVQTVEALRMTSKALTNASKRFYIDYLKPHDIVITLTAQEVR